MRSVHADAWGRLPKQGRRSNERRSNIDNIYHRTCPETSCQGLFKQNKTPLQKQRSLTILFIFSLASYSHRKF